MSFAFKRFSFFGQHDTATHAFPTAAATCAATGAGRVFVGCDGGALHVLDEAFRAVVTVPAYGHKLLLLAWAEVRGCFCFLRPPAGAVGGVGEAVARASAARLVSSSLLAMAAHCSSFLRP